MSSEFQAGKQIIPARFMEKGFRLGYPTTSSCKVREKAHSRLAGRLHRGVEVGLDYGEEVRRLGILKMRRFRLLGIMLSRDLAAVEGLGCDSCK